MTRLAIYLQDAHPIPEAIEYVRYAEERGFEAAAAGGRECDFHRNPFTGSQGSQLGGDQ